MTIEQHTEGGDAVDESMDSPVIKALRKQISDLQKQVNSAPTRESIEAEIRTELERESAISAQLIELGHPAGMSELLKGKLGDAEVSRETVASALQSIGYSVDEADAAEEATGEAAVPNPDLAKVSSLSAKVASAATAGPQDLTERINQAETPEQLSALMAEANLLSNAY